MTTHDATTRTQRIRSFVRHAWSDQVAANRALMQLRPYDDYLINRRSGR